MTIQHPALIPTWNLELFKERRRVIRKSKKAYKYLGSSDFKGLSEEKKDTRRSEYLALSKYLDELDIIIEKEGYQEV